MFDSEIFPARGQGAAVAISALSLAIPAGLLLLDPPCYHAALPATREGLRALAMAGELALLTLIFALTGVLALLAWQSLFPSRRDYLALAGLPVRSRQVFVARFVSVLLVSLAIAFAMIPFPSAIASHYFTAGTVAGASPAARALSFGLGCLFVFFAVVAVQGVLVNALPARLFARVSVQVQGLLISVCCFAGLHSWFIVDWREQTVGRLPEFGAWMPPVWFMGLDRTLAGDRDPFLAAMAVRGLAAAAGALTLAALTYLVAFRRYRKLLLEAPDGTARRAARRWSLIRLVARDPHREAAMQFLAQAFARSRMHRLVVTAYLGAGLALMINSALLAGTVKRWSGGWPDVLRFVAVYWPIGLSFILLAGVRHAFLIPAEGPANWLFRIAESQGRRQWMPALERFVMVFVIAPLHLAAWPIAVASFGGVVALRMTVLQVLVSLSTFEFLFYSWQQFPFTCSYVPGKRPLVGTLARWLAVLGVITPMLARIVAAMSQMLELFSLYLAIFAAVWLWARRQRREGWGEARLIYEDRDGAVADLGIKEMTYGGPAADGSAETEAPASPARVSSRPVAAGRRMYRVLEAAFPHEFRNAYGEEMMQTTEDSIEPIWRRHGLPGLIRLLADFALRVPAEYWAELRQDVRFGLRMLAASPGFTAVSLVSLTLGIGVATCAFSELNGFVLRDVPGVLKPGELVTLAAPDSYPNYKHYRRQAGLFAGLAAYVAPVPFGVSGEGRAERIWGHLVTPSYFSTLGVHPALGRLFGALEEQPGRAPTVVISDRFWRNHFGADPAAVGKLLRINGRPCTVVGVGPEDFEGASPMVYRADLWLPVSVGGDLAPELAGDVLERRDRAIFQIVGRLQPGVAAASAEAALDAAARQLEREHGDPERDRKNRRVRLLPGGKLLPIRKQDLPLFTSFFVVLGGMILLIASSNVTNMTLARAADRRREIAVRLALGASRVRLIRQLLTESMLVAAGAGGLGFLLASWIMRVASQFSFPYPMPLTFRLEPDGRVLLFTLALTAFTGLVFGLLPALQATRTDLTPALKEGGNLLNLRYRRLSLRNLLMPVQVAGSLALLLITGFLVIGHQRIAGSEVGFEARHLYMLSLDPIRDGYSGPQTTAFFEKLLDRVRSLPSINAASLADSVPMAMIGRPGVSFSVAGPAGAKTLHSARRFTVGRDYFETIGIPILRGRGFGPRDEADSSMAAIVSEKLAQECWPGQDPLGRRIELGNEGVPEFRVAGYSGGRRPDIPARAQVFEVVGVARNVRDGLNVMNVDAPALLYLPLRPGNYARSGMHGLTLVVRAAPGADAIGALRREISALDDRLTTFNSCGMLEQIERMMFPVRMALRTYGFIGITGLILASVGLAGVTAYSVTRRRREIGIRIALGARRADILGLVMKEGAVLILIGSLIGFLAARAGIRFLSATLSIIARTAGASASDPVLLAGTPLLVAILALIACYLPARRSLGIDPAVALRQE
ncbi:MAG: ABC transporter permease [Acidobacteria bacterium]|nr:ABC transporter permease [Acidobacteriota bacterium]